MKRGGYAVKPNVKLGRILVATVPYIALTTTGLAGILWVYFNVLYNARDFPFPVGFLHIWFYILLLLSVMVTATIIYKRILPVSWQTNLKNTWQWATTQYRKVWRKRYAIVIASAGVLGLWIGITHGLGEGIFTFVYAAFLFSLIPATFDLLRWVDNRFPLHRQRRK